jgi:hypothetical protein
MAIKDGDSASKARAMIGDTYPDELTEDDHDGCTRNLLGWMARSHADGLTAAELAQMLGLDLAAYRERHRSAV